MCYNNMRILGLEGIGMQRNMTKEEKFDEIYRIYENEVFKISRYYTNDEYTAQDITQKAFYKLFQHFDNVNLDSVRAYLLRTARNLSFNWLRDMKHEQGDYIDNIPEESAILLSAEDEYILDERVQERKQFASEILHKVREENESWYDILHLIYIMEKSHDEVARELGMSRDVLYSKLYRAKKWIQRHFEDEYLKL